ncbi:MAG: PH domain-containing protein [Pseudomonadota bacterium]
MIENDAPEGEDLAGLIALDPRQKSVLRVRSLLGGLIPLIMLTIGDFVLNHEFDFPGGWIASAGVLLYILTVLILPSRRYQRWGYRQSGRAIRIASGLIIRRETIVPYDRVQHIDVSRGPIERAFGVATLTLHTAGSYNSTVDLPGLAIDDANRMRDEIRSYISEDLA